MKGIASEKLGMTLEQMEEEIIAMRAWDRFLERVMDADQYEFLVRGYAREQTRTFMREMGATEEEIREACDFAEEALV